nr:putative reverse transcriptase domain-containing protein [Tanacetum cinerariifolium]
MPPRMMIQSAGRETATPRGERMGGRTGRGGGRTRGRSGDKGMNLLPTMVAQVGSQGSDQGNGRNQNGNAVNENIRGEVRNVIKNNDSRVCTYKEFLACNLKEYDGVVEATEPTTIQKVVHIGATLTDEAIRNGSIKKNHENRGNGGEPSKDRNGMADNKRTRTGNAFATTTNPVRRENTCTTPKCTPVTFSIHLRHHVTLVSTVIAQDILQRIVECGGTDHYKSTCLRLNRSQGPGVNRPNQALAIDKGQGRGNNGNQARGRAFMSGAEEARQDPRIVTSTFTLNNHYAINLFDSGTNYSFVSTTFIPLLGIQPSELGFSYEFEIASGQLVKIDKVIKGCKLEIEGHEFDINLIPFGSRNFDVIIGMDWLSNHKAEIICHEKVVRIPLLDGKVLRVLGERPKEKSRHLMSVKAKEQKEEEMVVVRDFTEVFSDDLSGLPPIREIEFQIESGYHQLRVHEDDIPKTTFRTRYRHFEFTVMPFDLTNTPATQEEQEVHLGIVLELLKEEKLYVKFSKCKFWLREVQFLGHVINGDGIHVNPSKTEGVKNWEAPRTLSEVRSFLGLAGETLKDKLCNAHVLALLDRPKDFVVYYDAFGLGLGCVLMQEVLLKGDVRTLIMDEAYKLKYSVHPRADKMYYDLRDKYWWSRMKKDIAMYQPEIPEWKCEMIEIDFVTKLPRTSSGHDTIWVIMDQLTKSAHFLPMREDYKMDKLARLYLNEIVAGHGVLISIIFDRDSHFTSRFWQSMQEALGTCLDMSTAYHTQTDGQMKFSYNNSYRSSVRCVPFEALYGRKCRSLIMQAEIIEGQLIEPELVESLKFCTRHHDAQKDCAAVRAEIEVLRNERLAYEQE